MLTEESDYTVVAPYCCNMKTRVPIAVAGVQGAAVLEQALNYGLEPLPTGTQQWSITILERERERER